MAAYRYLRYCCECGKQVTKQNSRGIVRTVNKVTAQKRICHDCDERQEDE